MVEEKADEGEDGEGKEKRKQTWKEKEDDEKKNILYTIALRWWSVMDARPVDENKQSQGQVHNLGGKPTHQMNKF